MKQPQFNTWVSKVFIKNKPLDGILSSHLPPCFKSSYRKTYKNKEDY